MSNVNIRADTDGATIASVQVVGGDGKSIPCDLIQRKHAMMLTLDDDVPAGQTFFVTLMLVMDGAFNAFSVGAPPPRISGARR